MSTTTPPPPPPRAPEGSEADDVEAAGDERSSRIEVIAAIILGIAATITAFAAYQAALADGDALKGYTESQAQLADANFFYNQVNQQYAFDQQLFLQYTEALYADNEGLATEIFDLMDPHLQEAVTWLEENDYPVPAPFFDAEGNPYAIPNEAEAEDLQAASEQRFLEGQEADDAGDKFELAAVFLAVSLFFAGIAPLFKVRSMQWVLLLMGAVTLAVGSVQTATAL